MVISSRYNKVEHIFRMGIWFVAATMMAIPTPLISFGIGHIKGSLSPWRHMFISAGCITITWAFVILLCLDSDPITTEHLN
ncbi:hypothetical protein CEP52_012863 [Fusarium oligoseptatum]|uniref:Uncharacterized protein n=2 Tax=Fusarium solani species complex TaxID=232080 RepID=A0A428SWL3_9HYPO|nr:hypothetical protein CEP51_014950 [Fusarium floridanum]RSL94080.1 hypothetical protein CEP52_012863 [Fusarium oligoseptatum]